MWLASFLALLVISHVCFNSWNTITGWAVAITCYISHSAKNRKTADFDPCGAETPESISMKLEGGSTWVVWANRLFVTSLSFFSFFFLLSSSRLQVAFLDRSRRFMHQNACFRPRKCLLWVSTKNGYPLPLASKV